MQSLEISFCTKCNSSDTCDFFADIDEAANYVVNFRDYKLKVEKEMAYGSFVSIKFPSLVFELAGWSTLRRVGRPLRQLDDYRPRTGWAD